MLRITHARCRAVRRGESLRLNRYPACNPIFQIPASWQVDSIRKAIDAHVKRFSMSKKNPLKSIRNDL